MGRFEGRRGWPYARSAISLAMAVTLGALSMSIVVAAPPRQPRPPVAHRGPLDPLVTSEIDRAFRVIERSGKLPEGAFFPTVILREPPKSEVLAWKPGQAFRREAFAVVYVPASNQTWEAVVDLNARALVSWTEKTSVQPPIHESEYTTVEDLTRADPRWQQAMRDRGIDPKDVYLDSGWGVGDLVVPGVPAGTRLLRTLSFFRGKLPNPYDRPIEGVVVTIDMNRRRVVEVIDSGVKPVDTTTTGSAPRPRKGLTPLVVRQPRGPSFRIAGNAVSWRGWQFRVGFNQRDGMVLHEIGFRDRGEVRPIIHRLGLDEIFVPYADPDSTWAWRAALDIGEFNLGQWVEPLQRGVDVPDNTVFFDEASPGDAGSTREDPEYILPHAIALYERDAGVLWDRTDPTSLERDVRRGRELVVTSSYANGNYTYLVEYAFGMYGSINVAAAGTGTTLNKGVDAPEDGAQFGTPVTQTISAPAHQHFFNFRIDFDVDGPANRVVEQDLRSVASSAGNAFVTNETPIETEGFRDAAPGADRRWEIQSTTRQNAVGHPTAYELAPGDLAQPYADAHFGDLKRAAFAEHPVWITRYQDRELYAPGDYPNQSARGEGLPTYIADGANVDGEDLVVWYTAAFSHTPHVEDYPVMTLDRVRFAIEPSGFFDQNPTLDAQ